MLHLLCSLLAGTICRHLIHHACCWPSQQHAQVCLVLCIPFGCAFSFVPGIVSIEFNAGGACLLLFSHPPRLLLLLLLLLLFRRGVTALCFKCHGSFTSSTGVVSPCLVVAPLQGNISMGMCKLCMIELEQVAKWASMN